MAAIGSVWMVRTFLIACALMLTWLCAHTCAAQHIASATSSVAATSTPTHVLSLSFNIDARSTARTELANLNANRNANMLRVDQKVVSPWLVAAASTTAAFAAGYAALTGASFKVGNDASRTLERSRGYSLGLEQRLRLSEQAATQQERASMLSRVSDFAVAGAVASAGVTLLVWLHSKRKRQEQQIRTLIGPLVVHGGGASGGGIVARAKF